MDKQIEEMSRELREIQPLFYASIAEQLYNAGYRKIPENAVVLTREAYNRLFIKAKQSEIKTIDLESIVNARKETAEKFASLIEFHSVATIDDSGVEQFTISALGLKEILHEEFGIPYDEIAKKLTEVEW